jgi:hypothetical protein
MLLAAFYFWAPALADVGTTHPAFATDVPPAVIPDGYSTLVSASVSWGGWHIIPVWETLLPKAWLPKTSLSIPSAIAPDQHPAGTEAPTAGNDAPTAGTEAPTAGNDAPTAGTEAPTAGTEAPAPAIETSSEPPYPPVRVPDSQAPYTPPAVAGFSASVWTSTSSDAVIVYATYYPTAVESAAVAVSTYFSTGYTFIPPFVTRLLGLSAAGAPSAPPEPTSLPPAQSLLRLPSLLPHDVQSALQSIEGVVVKNVESAIMHGIVTRLP